MPIISNGYVLTTVINGISRDVPILLWIYYGYTTDTLRKMTDVVRITTDVPRTAADASGTLRMYYGCPPVNHGFTTDYYGNTTANICDDGKNRVSRFTEDQYRLGVINMVQTSRWFVSLQSYVDEVTSNHVNFFTCLNMTYSFFNKPWYWT